MYGSTDLIFLHSNYYPDCRARVDKRFDGYWSLQFGESGGVEVLYGDDKWHLLAAGEAWFWPAYPGPRIRFHAAPGEDSWRHRYAAFQGPRVARWVAAGLFPAEPQLVPSQLAAEYARRFDALLGFLRRTGTDRWSHARAVNALEALLLELAAERDDVSGTARAEAQAPLPGGDAPSWLAYLLAAGDGDAEATDYAAFARAHGMSLSTLRRRFREAAGTPLHAFVVQQRITRARTLLGETDLPVKDIAHRLGYRDVYFFTRQFRVQTGVPPAAYRRSRQL